jgi:chaperone required for assembly of F1-ATPase
MPMTRAPMSPSTRCAASRDEVAALIADYGATDLLCYRAEAPAALVARQAAAWDPLLAGRRGASGAPLAGDDGGDALRAAARRASPRLARPVRASMPSP